MVDPASTEALLKVAEMVAAGAAGKKVIEAVFVPPADEAGALLKRLTHTALVPLRALAWGFERIEDWIATDVARRLRDVPPERIQTPAPEIAVPALMAVAYTQAEELRRMFGALLAKSMDAAAAADVHPSFVEVIKQLTPDEARLLAILSSEPPAFFFQFDPPVSNPVLLVEGTSVFPGPPHFTDLFKRAGFRDLARASVAISNLRRQNLVEFGSFTSFRLVSEVRGERGFARLLALTESLQDHVDRALAESTPLRVLTMILDLTPYGRSFCSCCVDATDSTPPVVAGT